MRGIEPGAQRHQRARSPCAGPVPGGGVAMTQRSWKPTCSPGERILAFVEGFLGGEDHGRRHRPGRRRQRLEPCQLRLDADLVPDAGMHVAHDLAVETEGGECGGFSDGRRAQSRGMGDASDHARRPDHLAPTAHRQTDPLDAELRQRPARAQAPAGELARPLRNRIAEAGGLGRQQHERIRRFPQFAGGHARREEAGHRRGQACRIRVTHRACGAGSGSSSPGASSAISRPSS